MGRLCILLLLISAITSATSIPALCQDERITSFISEITINKDASMVVTETITITCAGQQIQHGIYRDFPTRYYDAYGRRFVVDFDVIDVTKNNSPEPFVIEPLSNGKRVKIGSADVILDPGTYTYKITYKTNRQLGFFDDHDELYWNVTGNGWIFPIDYAAAIVTLPEGIPADKIKLEAYTGPKGARENNYRASLDNKGRAVFITTSGLAPQEGLTIVIMWPKGFVEEPSAAIKMRWMIRDNRGLLVGIAGFIILLAYYLIVWAKVGKDPEKGVIVPTWDPPKGLSPAAIRYIRRMGYDNKAISAAIINAAVKGCIKISEDGGDYTIESTGKPRSVLSPEENAVVEALVGSLSESKGLNSIRIEQSNHAFISAAIKNLRETLSGLYGTYYFRLNQGYAAVGIVISITFALAAIATDQSTIENPERVALMIWLIIWSFAVGALLVAVVQAWRRINIHKSGLETAGTVVAAGCITLFVIPFIAAWIIVPIATGLLLPWGLLGIIAAMGFMDMLFLSLLKAPTPAGRKLLDEIEGFRMYLQTAERDELRQAGAPEMTTDLYEKYLPYALALDVEQEWSEKFADVLACASKAEQQYSPAWYSGSHWQSVGASGFAMSIGSSITTAISSSSTPPGSSSGGSGFSGGGGSSGGGGGGGGGGGW